MTLILGPEDSGKRVAVTAGGVIEVQLPENPTTGYRWALASDPASILQTVEWSYVQEHSAPGGGGTRRIVFRAHHAGTAPVRLKQWREWLGDSSIIERYNLDVEVTDG